MLAHNLTQFARVLRRAGIAVGTDRLLAGVRALEAVGLGRREDVHAALSAVMLERHEQQAVFDAAFEAFWRDPKLLERMMYLLLPKVERRGDARPGVVPRAAMGGDVLADLVGVVEPLAVPPMLAEPSVQLPLKSVRAGTPSQPLQRDRTCRRQVLETLLGVAAREPNLDPVHLAGQGEIDASPGPLSARFRPDVSLQERIPYGIPFGPRITHFR